MVHQPHGTCGELPFRHLHCSTYTTMTEKAETIHADRAQFEANDAAAARPRF